LIAERHRRRLWIVARRHRGQRPTLVLLSITGDQPAILGSRPENDVDRLASSVRSTRVARTYRGGPRYWLVAV
jgi:hypothetical protein